MMLGVKVEKIANGDHNTDKHSPRERRGKAPLHLLSVLKKHCQDGRLRRVQQQEGSKKGKHNKMEKTLGGLKMVY